MALEVYGNWGKLFCDSKTGQVISYDRSNSDSESLTDGYHDITRIDIDRYRREHGYEYGLVDILYVGYWYGPDNAYAVPERV